MVILFNIVFAVGLLAAVVQVNALVDTSGMTVVYSDTFDISGNWANPQNNWQISSSPDGWGNGNVAYISSTVGKNSPQNLITSPSSPIDLSTYKTVLLQFDSNAVSSKRGNQKENVIVTDEHGVQHVVWVKSKATFSGIQQIDISNYVAGNKSITVTFQYVKKGPAKDSIWEVDDFTVFGSTAVVKPYSTIQFNSSAYTVTEGDGAYAVLNLTRTQAFGMGTATVNWTCNDGTALAGINYGIPDDTNDFDVNGTVTFSATDDHKIILVPILDDRHYSVPDLSFNVSIEDVTDASGNTIVGTPDVAQVTINDADQAQAIVVSMPATAELNEGSTWSSSGSFTDTSDAGPWTATVNYGDGSGDQALTLNDDKTFALSHTYDDDGIYTAIVNVMYNDALFGSDSTTVTVDNVAPTATFNTNSPVDEGSDIEVSLTDPSDPSSADTAAGFTYAFDLGDGYGAFSSDNTASVPTTAVGVVTVKGKIMDKDGGVTEYTADVQVNPAAYTIHLVQGWNLISFPVVSTLKASDLAGTGVLIVASYNPGTGDYDAYSTVSSPPEYDITMSTDVGYFVYCTEATSITVYGSYPSGRSVTINPGWNLVGWSSYTSSTAKAVCDQPSLADRQIVAKYNTVTGDYDAYAEGSSPDEYDFAMHDGEGYFIYSMSSIPQTLYFEAI